MLLWSLFKQKSHCRAAQVGCHKFSNLSDRLGGGISAYFYDYKRLNTFPSILNCRAVGPGHVSLVMNDVLSKLVNVGYKPAKVLKELQLETDENDDADMEKQVGGEKLEKLPIMQENLVWQYSGFPF